MYHSALCVVFVFVAVVPVPAGKLHKCPAGYHVGPDGESCPPCPPKHYMPENDHTHKQCWLCDDESTQLGDWKKLDRPCTWTNNTKKICIPSIAFRDHFGNCKPCKLCQMGEIETTPCTERSDRVCQASTSTQALSVTQAPDVVPCTCDTDKERNGDGTGDSPTPMVATVAPPKPRMPPPEYDGGKRSSNEPVPRLENDNGWESVYFWVIIIVIIVSQVISHFLICWKFRNENMSFCRAKICCCKNIIIEAEDTGTNNNMGAGVRLNDSSGGAHPSTNTNREVEECLLQSIDSGLSATSTSTH